MKHLKYFKENHIYNEYPELRITSDYGIALICDGYLETAIWTEEENVPNLEDKSIFDFSDDAIKQAKEEIKWFIKSSIDVANAIFGDASYSSIGHYLWLSKNGHGAGFFDRNYENVNILMELSHQLGEIYLEVDANDKICFSGGSEKYKSFDVEKYKEDIELKKASKKYNI